MTQTIPLQDFFAAPLFAGGDVNTLAEQLLSKVAANPCGGLSITYADLRDRQSQRLIRPVLACLAKKAADEGGTEFTPYGGTLSFIRDGSAGPVQITGEFENRPGAVRLAFRRPEPIPPLETPQSAAKPAEPPLSEVLAAVVRKYQIAETGFVLATDLDRLNLARTAGAHEAVVLYCTRVVEAMARASLREPGRLPSEKLADLLRELVDYQSMPVALKRWLDLLRYLGNDARHATRPVSEDDADVAFAVLLRWLYWTFCEAPRGPKLASLTAHNQPTNVLLPRELARLMDDAEATGEAVLAQLTDAYPSTSPALQTPMVPAAAAESLVARGQLYAAGQVLDIALRRFPRDLRLRQLFGLYWSRRGKAERNVEFLHRAVKELTSLLPQVGGSAADEETFGILAGVYKRLADLDSENSANWLELSCKTYRTGWEKSGFTNYYLGINAAAMTVLLGHPCELVERVAVRIRDGIAALEERLRATGRGDRPLGYWDQVTWAEAELLMGDWDRAGALYQDGFARFDFRRDDIAVSVGQAVLILDRLGQPELAIKVLGRWAPTH